MSKPIMAHDARNLSLKGLNDKKEQAWLNIFDFIEAACRHGLNYCTLPKDTTKEHAEKLTLMGYGVSFHNRYTRFTNNPVKEFDVFITW